MQKPTNTSPPAAGGKIPMAALLTLIIGAFMAILDGSIVNVALPRMMAIFGSAADQIQWVLTGYMLTTGVVIPITGYLSDRFGGKKIYILSLAAFTAGSALCSLAWSNNSLVVARVIQAVGGGMMMPVRGEQGDGSLASSLWRIVINCGRIVQDIAQ